MAIVNTNFGAILRFRTFNKARQIFLIGFKNKNF